MVSTLFHVWISGDEFNLSLGVVIVGGILYIIGTEAIKLFKY